MSTTGQSTPYWDVASGAAAAELEARYRARLPVLEHAATLTESLLTHLVDGELINYLRIYGRAKSVDSFIAKAIKLTETGEPRYVDPLDEITDQVAVRVITYLPDDVGKVCALIRDQLEVVEDTDKGEAARERGSFGYASHHFLARIDGARASLVEYAPLHERTFEIQVRTVVQHAWAEFEHEIRYKRRNSVTMDLAKELNRGFERAAALLEMADEEFSRIDHLIRAIEQQPVAEAGAVPGSEREPVPRAGGVPVAMPNTGDPASGSEPAAVVLSPEVLRSELTRRYPDATRSRREHYDWMAQVLQRLGIETTADLDRALADVDSEAVADAMDHRYPPGHVRRLDDDLLAALGGRYITVSVVGASDPGRDAILRRRRQKLESAARGPVTKPRP